MILTATENEVYEAGIYRLRLQAIEDKTGTVTDKATGESKPSIYLRWVFDILEEGFEGKIISANSSTAFGPFAKARGWAEALLARPLHPNEPIDTEALPGYEVMATLKIIDKNGTKYNEIEALAPVRRKPQHPAQTPQRPQRPQSAPQIDVIVGQQDFDERMAQRRTGAPQPQGPAIHLPGYPGDEDDQDIAF